MRKRGRPKGTDKKNGWKHLSEKQLEDFFKAIRKERILRDDVILSLALYLGLRVQEIVNIQVDEIEPETKTITIQGVKSGRRRNYPDLDERLWKKLQRYMKTLDKDEVYLFPSPKVKGKPITTQAVKDLFKKYAGRAGLSSDYSIHALRHTCAMLMAKKNESAIKIQHWLRHASIQSTQIYFERIEFEDQARAASRVFGSYM